jgi:VWFA-related protein
MSVFSRLLSLLVFAALAFSVWAQTTPAPAAQTAGQPATVIKSETNLVQVPVLVTQGAGAPVSGLKAADFTLTDNGKPQAITVFEEVGTGNALLQRVAPPAGVYGNLFESAPQPARLTIIVVDLINTPFADQAYARQQIVHYLARKVNKSEPTALIAIGRSGTHVIHDFTSDTSLLVRALQKMSGEIPVVQPVGAIAMPSVGVESASDAGVAAEVATVTAGISDTLQSSQRFEQRIAIYKTLESFQHVAQAFAAVPGRKSLMWVTAAFPFYLDPNSGSMTASSVFAKGNSEAQFLGGSGMDSSGGLPSLPSGQSLATGLDLRDLIPVFERTFQMLGNANIAVYPIDARGLMTFFPDASSSSEAAATIAAINRAEFESSRDTMSNFADMTGGRAFYNTNDLATALDKASSESTHYYMLGYYLPKDAKPGWHKLKVKLDRGGITVRERSGFYVLASKPGEKQEAAQDVAMALSSPLDYTAQPMVVRWAGTPTPAGAKKDVPFLVILPPAGIPVDESDNNHVDVEFIAVARTPDGKNAATFDQEITANLKPDALAKFKVEGLRYGNKLQLPPGEYAVRFVVRDRISGRMGSVTAPLQVP